jgi:3-isopropylmalate/(R)-2-methylmalate dehydratase small subunit
MRPFQSLTAVAAPLPLQNIDTDQIIPKQFLKMVQREGLGDKLFFDLRYDEAGVERASFVLNQEAYRSARILVTGHNFGCGSSREHAVWALMDYGVECVISTGFSDIFAGNCIKNGLLAATVSELDRDALLAELQNGPGTCLSIDLLAQTIRSGSGREMRFWIDAFARKRLLEGRNEIDTTLQYSGEIARYEAGRVAREPWMIPGSVPTPQV